MPNPLLRVAEVLARQPWASRAQRLIVGPDRFLLRMTRGRFGLLRLVGLGALMLHTTGRRTGLERATPLLCVPDGDGWLIAGSNWGQQHHPAWVHNLRSGGAIAVTFGGVRRPARARELTGAERAGAYARMVGVWRNFERYARTAGTREIPVFHVSW